MITEQMWIEVISRGLLQASVLFSLDIGVMVRRAVVENENGGVLTYILTNIEILLGDYYKT